MQAAAKAPPAAAAPGQHGAAEAEALASTKAPYQEPDVPRKM